MLDWDSFWINIYAGGIYFILGILFSIWLIPIFTLKLIKRKSRKFFRYKIAFLIGEVCNFFNKMPHEFKANEEMTTFYVTNKKFPDLKDFVGILKPNLFKPAAYEKTIVKISQCIVNFKGQERYDLVKSELDRLSELKKSLENLIDVHSLNFNDTVINHVSLLCLEINQMQTEFDFNKVSESLTGEKDGLSGASRIAKLYEKIFELLKILIKEKGITQD